MKLVELATYLVYVATYGIVLPMLVGFYSYRHLTGILRFMLMGLVLTLVLDVALLFFAAKNTFLYLFSVVDVLMFSWIFSKAVYNNHTGRLILTGGTLVVVLIGLDAFFYSGLATNGLSNALAKAFLVAIAVLYLSQLMQNLRVTNLSVHPLLWIGVGVLIYNATGLFDAFSKPVLSYSQNLYLQYYIIWSIVTIVMYGFFTYAFWMARQVDAIP